MLAMVVGPLMPWTLKARMGRIFKYLAPAALIAVLALLGNWLWAPQATLVGTLGLGLAVWVGVGTLLYGWRVYKLQDANGVMARLKRIPRNSYGLILAHGGVAIITTGITMSGAWQSDFEGKMNIGDSVDVGAYTFTLDKVDESVPGPNYDARQATFTVTKGDSLVRMMYPETRFYTAPPTQTTEAAISTGFTEDLYAVIGEPSPGGGYAIRIYDKPLVSWIWGGAIVMALGGAIAMTGRRKLPVVSQSPVEPEAHPAGAAE
jgi:cytochrome c-type biogenesis protein CcmF